MDSEIYEIKDAASMAARAEGVATFLKGLASPQRLLVLCALMAGEQAGGERTVGELVAETGIAPTSMSQHLARLRDEGIVALRRDHRTHYYSIAHPATGEIMAVLYRHFCGGGAQAGDGQ